MLASNGADYKGYEKKLKEINQLISRRSLNPNHVKILWLNQFPTIDFWAQIERNNADIYAEKIYHYNSILKNVFR